MVSRLFAFLVWAACAVSMTYWGLQWFSKPLSVPNFSATVAMVHTPRGDMARLLSPPANTANSPDAQTLDQSALSARFQLIGLMATANVKGPGVALLSIDGKPAKAFRVGQSVDGENIVLSISKDAVSLGLPNSTASVNLTAQSLPPPTTGTLPSDKQAPTQAVPGMPQTPSLNQPSGNNMSGTYGGPGNIPGLPPRHSPL